MGSSRAGRTPHHWRHRHGGEEDSAQLTMLVGSARASLECAAAGTLGDSSSAEPPLTIVAAAGTVQGSAEFFYDFITCTVRSARPERLVTDFGDAQTHVQILFCVQHRCCCMIYQSQAAFSS